MSLREYLDEPPDLYPPREARRSVVYRGNKIQSAPIKLLIHRIKLRSPKVQAILKTMLANDR